MNPHAARALLVAAALFLIPSSLFARRIYVDGRVETSGDGGAWSQAVKTIKEGVEMSQEGDIVWVAGGTYGESMIELESGITLNGGFAGTETTIFERESENTPTIIDASLSSNVKKSRIFVVKSLNSSTIEGFHLTGISGFSSSVYVYGGCTIMNCSIDSPRDSYAVIGTYLSGPIEMVNCVIVGASNGVGGGSLYGVC